MKRLHPVKPRFVHLRAAIRKTGGNYNPDLRNSRKINIFV